MALPPVGVQLVAQDSDKFQAAMAAAQGAVDSFGISAGGIASGGLQLFAGATAASVGALSGLGNVLGQVGGILTTPFTAAINFVGSAFDRVFNQVIRLAIRQVIRDIESFIGSMAQAALKGSELETDFGRLDETLKEIGHTAFAPFIDNLGKLVTQAAPAFLGIAQAGEDYLGGLATNALTWGQNVANQFAQGIWDGIGSVLEALTGIAKAVAYWLAPGSPPRLLPDIDKWGTAAANQFLSGWAKADFSVFSDLSGTLTSLIQSIPIGKGDQAGVIPAILGAREGIAAAVEELRTAGTISEATLGRITAAVGTSAASVRDYLMATIKLQAANKDVADAQDQLNQVTKTYQDLLKPVDAQIAGITEAQQELADSQKRSLLELVLKDPNASAAQKQAAQLEIDKLAAEQRRRLLLAEQKTAVDSATAKLDAAKRVQAKAQEAFDDQREKIKLETDQNNLLREQLRLLEQLAKQAKPKAAGGGAPTPKPFEIKPLDLSKLIPEGIKERWAAFTAALAEDWAKIQKVFQPTIDAIQQHLIPAIGDLKKAWDDSVPDIESQIGRLTAFMILELGIVGPQIVNNMSRILDDLADVWRNHHNTILNVIGLVFSTAFAAVLVSFNTLVALLAIGMDILATVLDVGSLVLQGKWQEAWDRIKQGNREFWDIVTGLARTNWELFLGIFRIKLADLLAANKLAFDEIAYKFGRFLYGLGYDLGQAADDLKRKWDQATADATAAWENTKTAVSGKLTEISDNIHTTITNALSWLSGKRQEFVDAATSLMQGFIDGAGAKAQAMIDAVLGPISDAIAAAKRLLNIKSPSRVFMEIGSNITAGLAEGISQGKLMPTVALTGVLGGLVSAAGAVNNSYANTTHFIYSPTYHSAPGRVTDNFATMVSLWS